MIFPEHWCTGQTIKSHQNPIMPSRKGSVGQEFHFQFNLRRNLWWVWIIYLFTPVLCAGPAGYSRFTVKCVWIARFTAAAALYLLGDSNQYRLSSMWNGLGWQLALVVCVCVYQTSFSTCAKKLHQNRKRNVYFNLVTYAKLWMIFSVWPVVVT